MPFWLPAFSTDPFQDYPNLPRQDTGLYPVSFDTRLLLNETPDLRDKANAHFVIKRPQQETIES